MMPVVRQCEYLMVQAYEFWFEWVQVNEIGLRQEYRTVRGWGWRSEKVTEHEWRFR